MFFHTYRRISTSFSTLAILVGRSKGTSSFLVLISQFRVGKYLHCLFVSASRERQIRPIIVDPGLYLSSRNDIFYATQKRDIPNAYKLFTGKGALFLIYHYHTIYNSTVNHGSTLHIFLFASTFYNFRIM